MPEKYTSQHQKSRQYSLRDFPPEWFRRVHEKANNKRNRYKPKIHMLHPFKKTAKHQQPKYDKKQISLATQPPKCHTKKEHRSHDGE